MIKRPLWNNLKIDQSGALNIKHLVNSLTYKNHHNPDEVNCQTPLFGVRMHQVKHDRRDDEEKEAAHLKKKKRTSVDNWSEIMQEVLLGLNILDSAFVGFCKLTVLKYSTTCSEYL